MNEDAADGSREDTGGPAGEQNPYASPHAASAPVPLEAIDDDSEFTPAQRLRRETTLRGQAVARMLAAGTVIAWDAFPWPGGLWTRAIARLFVIAVLLAVGLALWRLRRWALWALVAECTLFVLAAFLLLATVPPVPFRGGAHAGLLAAAYVIAIQLALLQLWQTPLSRHVCSARPRYGETQRSTPAASPLLWKAALFAVFWAAGQFGAFYVLLGG